jgi:hypothetical protein
MMEAVRTSETSVDNHFTRQYNPEDSSEHHTRRRENLKPHTITQQLDTASVYAVTHRYSATIYPPPVFFFNAGGYYIEIFVPIQKIFITTLADSLNQKGRHS